MDGTINLPCLRHQGVTPQLKPGGPVAGDEDIPSFAAAIVADVRRCQPPSPDALMGPVRMLSRIKRAPSRAPWVIWVTRLTSPRLR